MAENCGKHVRPAASSGETRSASQTSAKYLGEIKAIYERLQSEYDYLRQKQQQFMPEDAAAASQDLPQLKQRDFGHHRKSVEKGACNMLDSDGLAPFEDVDEVVEYQGEKVDQMIASSVEELYDTENASLRERVAQLEAEVAAKSRDWRRIRTNFEQLQESNEKLKQQLNEANSERASTEKKFKQLSSRFANLQACQRDRSDAKTVKPALPSKSSAGPVKASKSDGDRQNLLLNLSLEALAEVASTGFVNSANKPSAAGCLSTNLIFALAELLRNLPSSLASQARIVDPLLRLFYDSLPWSFSTNGTALLVGEESTSADLRPGVNLSLQKCGEALFRAAPSAMAISNEPDGMSGSTSSSGASAPVRRSAAVFFRSPQLTTRFLSTLVILRTVTRADILAQALECLLRDCQSEAGREAFARFDAARVVVMFLRPHNKAFVGSSLAIITRLLTANVIAPTINFAEIFLTERYICALSMLLDSPAVSSSDLEKLSTILAKLATTTKKSKSSSGPAVRLFNAFGITETVQRMMKRLSNDDPTSSAAMSPVICSNFRQILSCLSTPAAPRDVTTGGGDSSIADDLSCGSLSLA